MKMIFYRILIFTFLFASLTIDTVGQIRLPKHVSDNMVIQRDERVKVWGWAGTNEEVTVRFKGKKYSTKSDKAGIWEIWLIPAKAGGPYDLSISSNSSELTVKNILIGDVWFCSGQSNMVHQFGRHEDRYAQEIAEANYPEIRQFLVPDNAILTGSQNDLLSGEWKAATPENVLDFTLVGYFLAKALYEQYDIPIGIIKSAVGGTPIRSWISESGLKEFPDLLEVAEQNKDTAYVNDRNRQARSQRSGPIETTDKGLTGQVKWFDHNFEPTNWKTMTIPGYWEDQGVRNLNGTVWFRKEIDVPSSMLDKPARIHIGRIVDADKVYINGQLVGSTGYQYPQRRYDFGAGILQEGKNTIVIQLTNYGGKGGFVPDKPYYLAAGSDTLSLIGNWKYQVGDVFVPRSFSGGVSPISAQNEPTSLFNGMVAPFKDFPVKGAVWYQGESDTWQAKSYDKLLKSLVYDWRNHWNDPELPILLVQLPNFLDVNYLPEESSWAEMRNSQLKGLEIPNTAMVITLNLGEWNDIHPGNKKPIGDRLALAARKLAYGEDLVYSGPIYSSAKVDRNKVTLSFDHVGSGLISSDDEALRWFAIAGMDKQFIWAKTKIIDDKVLVWNEDIPNPAYVRYAWADNPDNANFYNKEGLPASPFEAVLYDQNALWRGKKACVVLTYDDALEVQLDNVIPVLDANGLNGTFYLSGANEGSKNRIEGWKSAARRGHELGNHTIYHPCDANGRDWVTPVNDLSEYSSAQIIREVEMMNVFLQSLDGKTERTFAYTCGDTETSEGSFVDLIKDKFIALRGVQGEINKLETLDLTNVYAYGADGKNADEMIAWAEKAKKENGMLVIFFHGVGGGHSGKVELAEHNKLIDYLKTNEKDIWITTMLEAGKHAIEQSEK